MTFFACVCFFKDSISTIERRRRFEDHSYKPALSLLRLVLDGNEQQLQLHVTQPVKHAQPLKRAAAGSHLRLKSLQLRQIVLVLVCFAFTGRVSSTYQRRRTCRQGTEWYLLTDSGEGEAHKGTGQILCVHLISHAL